MALGDQKVRPDRILVSMSNSAAVHDLDPSVRSSTSRPTPGRVILLNGASSSGKSTIARELLTILDGAWFHMAIDHMHRVRSHKPWSDATFLPIFQRTVLGFHRAVHGMVSVGNDVVMDHVLGERWRLDDLLDVFDGVPVLFVGVRCSLPELERRERERANRTVGRAAVQFPLVHHHRCYDVDVDTETTSAADCAAAIQRALGEVREQSAFDLLRRSVDGRPA